MIQIGYTKKPHALKGELKVQIFEEYEADFLAAEVVFFLLKGKHIPYFIEKVKQGNTWVLKLEEVDSKEDSVALAGKELWMREQDVQERERKPKTSHLIYGAVEGFMIIDEEVGEVGQIEEILEMPQQEMAVVNYKNKEVFIPLNEQLIIKIETEKRIVHMSLPLGLLDIT